MTDTIVSALSVRAIYLQHNTHAHTHAHTRACPHTRTHVRTHAHAHTHAVHTITRTPPPGSNTVELSERMPDSQSREHGFESSLCYRFDVCAFSFSPRRISQLSCVDEYLAIDSGENVSEYSIVFARNCCVAKCFPEKPGWCRCHGPAVVPCQK